MPRLEVWQVSSSLPSVSIVRRLSFPCQRWAASAWLSNACDSRCNGFNKRSGEGCCCSARSTLGELLLDLARPIASSLSRDDCKKARLRSARRSAAVEGGDGREGGGEEGREGGGEDGRCDRLLEGELKDPVPF